MHSSTSPSNKYYNVTFCGGHFICINFMYVLFVLDALRIHKKYKDKINKDFNDPLANWLNHSKFRLLNKAVEKNKQTINCVL